MGALNFQKPQNEDKFTQSETTPTMAAIKKKISTALRLCLCLYFSADTNLDDQYMYLVSTLVSHAEPYLLAWLTPMQGVCIPRKHDSNFAQFLHLKSGSHLRRDATRDAFNVDT